MSYKKQKQKSNCWHKTKGIFLVIENMFFKVNIIYLQYSSWQIKIVATFVNWKFILKKDAQIWEHTGINILSLGGAVIAKSV